MARNKGEKFFPLGMLATLGGGRKRSQGFRIIFAMWVASIGLLGFKFGLARESEPKNLSMLQAWSGDYPVSELGRLPQNQRTSGVGYLGIAAATLRN